jgi:hypothetical protein
MQCYGKNNQICFDTEADRYEFLGYLAKNDGISTLVHEHNETAGAWGEEYRIQFIANPPAALKVRLSLTSGVGSIASRLNCNDFIEELVSNYGFSIGSHQNVESIKTHVPEEYIEAFERGLNL